MNKRIESLRKEAGLTPYYEDQSGQIQKFAELIVNECIDCALWVGNINSAPTEPIRTAHAIKHRIFNKLLKVKDE